MEGSDKSGETGEVNLREEAEKLIEADIILSATHEIKEQLNKISEHKFDIEGIKDRISERETEILNIEANPEKHYRNKY